MKRAAVRAASMLLLAGAACLAAVRPQPAAAGQDAPARPPAAPHTP